MLHGRKIFILSYDLFQKRCAAIEALHAFFLSELFIQILQFLYKIFMHSFFSIKIGEKRERCYNNFNRVTSRNSFGKLVSI